MIPAGKRALEDYLDIDLAGQRLALVRQGRMARSFPVSTAENGPGERKGSGCTPRGWHRIRARIGAGLPTGAVFVGRRPTGEIYTPQLKQRFPERDWILTRILWLGGLEPGRNRYGEVGTASRYIYIHGSPDESVGGAPGSRGCIRMKSADILELFEAVAAGEPVYIH